MNRIAGIALMLSLLLPLGARAGEVQLKVDKTAFGGKRIGVQVAGVTREDGRGETRYRSTTLFEEPAIQIPGRSAVFPAMIAVVQRPSLLRRFPLTIVARGKGGGKLSVTQLSNRRVVLSGQLLEHGLYGAPFKRTVEGKDAVDRAVTEANALLAASK